MMESVGVSQTSLIYHDKPSRDPHVGCPEEVCLRADQYRNAAHSHYPITSKWTLYTESSHF